MTLLSLSLVLLLGLFIVLVVNFVISIVLYSVLVRVPKEYRRVKPYFVWLILIPCVGLIFAWIVMPFKLPASLRSYFTYARKDIAEKETSYGKTDGLCFVISSTLILIPVVNSIAWLPALIVLTALIFLVRYLIIIKRFGNQLPDRELVASAQKTAP